MASLTCGPGVLHVAVVQGYSKVCRSHFQISLYLQILQWSNGSTCDCGDWPFEKGIYDYFCENWITAEMRWLAWNRVPPAVDWSFPWNLRTLHSETEGFLPFYSFVLFLASRVLQHSVIKTALKHQNLANLSPSLVIMMGMVWDYSNWI